MLTPATISNITADLIARGEIQEKPQSLHDHFTRTAGRRPIGLDLVEDRYTALGISMARDMTFFCICDLRGHILTSGTSEVMSDDYDTMLLQLKALIQTLKEAHPDLWERLLGIGLCVPAIVNTEQGTVKNHGNERLSWRNRPLTA